MVEVALEPYMNLMKRELKDVVAAPDHSTLWHSESHEERIESPHSVNFFGSHFLRMNLMKRELKV